MSEKRGGLWRVGSHVPENVYEGDRPVCMCRTAEDAKRIVDAINSVERIPKAKPVVLIAEWDIEKGQYFLAPSVWINGAKRQADRFRSEEER